MRRHLRTRREDFSEATQTFRQLLRLVLLCLRIFGLDGDVAHRGRAGGTVPVVFTRGDQNDIALGHGALLTFGRDHASAFGNDEDLVRGVLVELVARARAEVDDAEVEARRLRRIHDDLTEHFATREQRADSGLAWEISGADNFHVSGIVLPRQQKGVPMTKRDPQVTENSE
jgi:hypothetical protein